MRKLTFSDNDIAVSKRVFTCGYNSNLEERSFFSGSLVKLVSKFFLFIFSIQFWCLIFENYNSGVGIRNKTSKDATLYLHGSSTGIWGYVGSAVFDEKQLLVGMNILYTMSKGEGYASEKKSDFGGIIV